MTDVPLLFDPKTPTDVVPASLSFANILARGETINSYDVDCNPGDLELSMPTLDPTGKIVTTWVGAGSPGTSYYVIFHVITSAGKDETRSVIMNVKATVP